MTDNRRVGVHPMDIALGVAPGTWEREHGADASRRRTRKPSLTTTIKQVRKAGVTKGTVTVDNVSVTLGESETQQGNELDEWMKKHAH
jgi:hypothetical protein